MRHKAPVWLTVLVAALAACAWAQAPSKRETKPVEKGPMVTPEREAAAMTFVRQHHLELADLVERLKETRPAQYRRAVRELFAASEQLAHWKERDAKRYELELRAWKAKSRIQLLSARANMTPDRFPETELRAAIEERQAAAAELLKLQRESLARKLEKVDSDLQRLESRRAEIVDRQLAQLRQAAEKSAARRKPAAKNRKSDAEKPDAGKPKAGKVESETKK